MNDQSDVQDALGQPPFRDEVVVEPQEEPRDRHDHRSLFGLGRFDPSGNDQRGHAQTLFLEYLFYEIEDFTLVVDHCRSCNPHP